MKIGGMIGPYRLEEPVGGGGTLWTARHETLDRQVAVRFFDAGVEREAFVERTRALARLGGRHVAQVVDSGFTEDGAPYLMTALAAGRDLATRLRREGPLTPREAIEVGRAVLDVLDEMHRAGLAHGRLGPASVWLTPGEAAAVDRVDVAAAARPGAGGVAPEEARGAAPSPAGDLYAFGALIYEALGGQRAGGTAPPLRTQLPLAGVPEALDAFLAGCLADEPGARLAGVAEARAGWAAAEAALDDAAGDGWRLDAALGPRDDEATEGGWGLVTADPTPERALEPTETSSTPGASSPDAAAGGLRLELDHGVLDLSGDLSGGAPGEPPGRSTAAQGGGGAAPHGLALDHPPQPRGGDATPPSIGAGWSLDAGASLELARDPAAERGRGAGEAAVSLAKASPQVGSASPASSDVLDSAPGLELAFEPSSRRASVPSPPVPRPAADRSSDGSSGESTGEVPIVEPERALPPAPEGPFAPGMRSARLAAPPTWQERYRAGIIASGVVVGVLTLAWLVRGPMVEALGVEEAPAMMVDAAVDAEPRKLDIGPTIQVLDRGAGPAPALVRSGPLGDPGYEEEAPTVLVVPDPGPATFVRLDDDAVICEEAKVCKVPVDVDVSVRKAGYRPLTLSGDDLYDRRGSRWRVVLRR